MVGSIQKELDVDIKEEIVSVQEEILPASTVKMKIKSENEDRKHTVLFRYNFNSLIFYIYL